MTRLNQFMNPLSQQQRLTPATITRVSRSLRPADKYEQHTMQITLTDGSRFTIKSSLPQQNLTPVKDLVHHPLWNPRIGASQVDKSSEEFVKFRQKFDHDALDRLASGGSGMKHVVAKVAPVAAPSQKKSTRKKIVEK